MRRVFFISFLVLLFLSSVFYFAEAANDGRFACPTGLVPCGGPTCPCTLCDFIVMFGNIINFLLTKVVPSLAALMIAIGGFMLIFAHVGLGGGDSGMLSRAKTLFFSVVIGLVIIYGAWLIVHTFLWAIGATNAAYWMEFCLPQVSGSPH